MCIAQMLSQASSSESQFWRWAVVAASWAFTLLLWSSAPLTQVRAAGSWETVVDNAGIASMHTAVCHTGTVMLLDRTDIGPSQILLADGKCRDNPADVTLKHDCTAHSVEYSPDSNRIRPLFIFTDTWCSSGQFTADGTLVQTGGDLDGLYKIRRFTPCSEAAANCDWVEDDGNELQDPRWYASNQLLPDGRQILVGGRAATSVEFVPRGGTTKTTLDLLVATTDYQQDNLYPFVHLLPSGLLFIFANTASILYNYFTEAVVVTFPNLAGPPRNYPSAGSSVMLPLDAADGYTEAKVVVCGGAQLGAYNNPTRQPTAAADCATIVASDGAGATWAKETMPFPRTMGDMVMLPDSTTLIVNGARKGSQGWGEASDAIQSPVNYNPEAAAGSRFTVWTASPIPRVYHSTANLLPDGKVLIAGSNTHQFYTFEGVYPTELRLEKFSPPYLDKGNDDVRPAIEDSPGSLGYGDDFTVTVTIATAPAGVVNLVLLSSPFTTHSFSQGQRQLNLAVAGPPVLVSGTTYTIAGTSPPTAVLAPSTYYMLFAVNGKIPSAAKWVRIG